MHYQPNLHASGSGPGDLSKPQLVYVWLAAIFVTCLLLANIVGSKFFHFGTVHLFGMELHIEHSVGMLCFPVTFVLTDLINEYFGAKGARRVTMIGLACSLLAAAMLFMARAVPPAPNDRSYVDEAMFDTVLGGSGLMIIASMCAYIVGQMLDIAVFGLLNRLTGGKMVWLRATGSTIVSQLLDSFTIMMILYFFSKTADGSRSSFAFAIEGALKGYAIKFCIAVLTTPVLYAARGIVGRVFGLRPLPPAR